MQAFKFKIVSLLFLINILHASLGQFQPLDPRFLDWFWTIADDFTQVLKKLDYSQFAVMDHTIDLHWTGSATPPSLHGELALFDGFVQNMGLAGVDNRTVTCHQENGTVTFSGDFTIENTYLQYQYDANTEEQGHITGSASPMLPQISMKCAGTYKPASKQLVYNLRNSAMKAPYDMKYFPANNNTVELNRITKYKFTSYAYKDFDVWLNTTLSRAFGESILKFAFTQCNT